MPAPAPSMSVVQDASTPAQPPTINNSASSCPAGLPSTAQTTSSTQTIPENLFTWQAIWSFFMRAPRIRSWLFQKEAPPSEQVVQSLLSGPILTGYLFGSFSERVRSYSFPDIGDLHTVFCSDGDALLGFHFGFQGVQPVLPLLFQVAKDPSLGNPNVIVRRTARQKAPIPGLNCYLAIEFNWFQSGCLAVSTSVNPIDPEDKPPTGITAFFDNAEIRVFKRATAGRFAKIAQLYGESLDLGHFPHPSNFKKLPQDFLDPPDDYYTLTIREPVDPVYRGTLTPAYISGEQSFNAENDFASVRSVDLSSQSQVGGALMHCDRGDVSSVASPRTIQLWKGYQRAVANSRRTGIFSTMLAKKVGGLFGKAVSLFGREVRYTFLSTSGINVHGRIQRLCNQLGITYSSPLPDTALMSPTSLEGSTSPNSPGAHVASSGTYFENELDITKSTCARAESTNRTVTQLHLHQARRRYIAEKGMEADRVVQTRVTVPSHGSDPSMSFQSTEGSVPPSISQSTSTDLRATSSSEHDSQNGTRTRSPKRRRCSPESRSRILDLHGEMTEEVTAYDRAAKQEATRTPILIYPLSADNRGSARALLHRSVRQKDEDKQSLADQTQVRRRSFEITDMLSDGSKFHPFLHSNIASETLKKTPETSLTNGNSVSASASQAPNPGLPQAVGEPISDGTSFPTKLELKEGAPAKKGGGTVWTCDRCGVQIRGKKGNLNRHIANKHDNIRAYACKVPNCGRKFQTRLNLVRHETAVHLGRPFTCPSCPRAFKYEDDLRGHIKSAHEDADATLACDVCGSCFGRRSTLNRHKAKVHKLSEQQTSVT